MAPLHDRMPVIRPPKRWSSWLDAQPPLDPVRRMLTLFADGTPHATPVSTGVHDTRHHDPHVLDPSDGAQVSNNSRTATSSSVHG